MCVQSVLSVFRSLSTLEKTVDHFSLSINTKLCKLVFIFHCRHGTVFDCMCVSLWGCVCVCVCVWGGGVTKIYLVPMCYTVNSLDIM